MRRAIIRTVSAIVVLVASKVNADELRPETLQAWEQYVQAAETKMKLRLEPGHPFLWADEDPQRIERLRRGEIEIMPVGDHGVESVSHGLIHDWVGAVFIPNISLSQLLNVVQDYRRYKEFYKPLVIDSQVIGRTAQEDRFSMRWLHKVLFITAGLDTQYAVRGVSVDNQRYYSLCFSTNVQEIQNYGKPNQRELPPDHGTGFLWRVLTVSRYEERHGGVYVEIEAIGLSRDIPASLRMLVKPVVARLSRNSLLMTLEQTRDAVRSSSSGEPVADIRRAWAPPSAASMLSPK